MNDIGDVDPETFVAENREQVVKVIRHSSDPFIRACAWTLLDRYSDDPDLEELHEELEEISKKRGKA